MARSPAPYVHLPEPPGRLALSVARAATALARHHFNPMSKTLDELEGDVTAKNIILAKGAVVPSSTSTAASLAQTHIETLAVVLGPRSAAGQLFRSALNLSLDGLYAAQVPSAKADGSGVAFYGEGSPLPVLQYSIESGVLLKPQKLGFITALTRETIARSDADVVVRDLMQRNLSLGLEQILFDAEEGTAIRPQGLLHDIAPIVAGSDTSTEGMITDLSALAAAVAAIDANLVFIASPRQAVAINMRMLGNRFPYPLLSSSALADGTVIAIAPVGLAVVGSDAAPRIDTRREAAMHMESVPQPISEGTPAVAAPVRSLFQTDCIGLRLLADISWALRDSAAIAYTTNVAW